MKTAEQIDGKIKELNNKLSQLYDKKDKTENDKSIIDHLHGEILRLEWVLED
jgi:hypothetical protein